MLYMQSKKKHVLNLVKATSKNSMTITALQLAKSYALTKKVLFFTYELPKERRCPSG